MIKQHWVYFLFAASLALFVVTMMQGKQYSGYIRLTGKAIYSSAGWGYEIYTNDTLFIHQEYMPAVQGRQGFISETEAQSVANLVVDRLKQRKLPSVSLRDLDSLHITQ